MKYELYIDAFFLLNFLMDVLLLFLMKQILRCTATHFRLFVGAAFGAGAVSLLTIMPGIPAWIKLFAGYGIISICMLRISFKQMNLRQACGSALYLYGFAFLFGGIFQFLSNQFPFFSRYGMGVMGICVTGIFTYGSVSFLCERRKKKKESNLLQVTVVWKDKQKRISALVDTGNCLYEPIDRRPVSILEKRTADFLFADEKPAVFRAIPFHSVGKAHGILEGYELTALIITGEYEEIRIERPMLGLFDGQLSTDGIYEMILHPALTKKQEESV